MGRWRTRRGAGALALLVALGAGCGGEVRQRGLRQEAIEANRRGDRAAAVRLADEALRAGRPTPALDAELALVKADALGRLGFPGERARLLRYVTAVHGESRFADDARAALGSSAPAGADPAPSGAILPAVVVVERPWLRRPVEVFYPLEASLVGLEGSVHLVLEADRAGDVVGHRVQAATDPAFARAVEGAVRDFAIDPDALRGRGSRRTKRVLLDFRLREPGGVTRDARSP